MRVKQSLRINAIVATVAALVILVVLSLAIYRINRALEAAAIVDAIITSSFERLILRTDFFRTGSERSKEQMAAKHAQVGGLLKRALQEFSDPEDRKTVNELLTLHESIGKISGAIQANREKRGAGAPPGKLAREIEERQFSQLDMRVYKTILLDGKLQQSSHNVVISSLKLAVVGIFAVILLVSAVIMINSIVLSRSITDRLRRLSDGSLVIGQGGLDHVIDIQGNNEFTELAGAFNAMTAKLRDSYRFLQREVEDRKQAEESLRNSERRYRSFVELTSQFAWVTDASGQVVEDIPTLRKFTGQTYEEAKGTGWSAALHPDDLRHTLEVWERAVAARSQYEVEYRMRRQDGVYRLLHARGVPVLNEQGIVMEWVGTCIDITERKLAEETLQEAHDALQKMLGERTRDLREKEVLLKEIHHRVKNNLQVISSLVSLQADGSKDETVREVLKDVTDRVRSMALVHEKLYQSTDLANIDFAEYSRGLLGYLWRAHGGETIALTLDLSPLSLPVDTAVPLGLILNELAGNALKHAFRGLSGGEVTVSLKGAPGGKISLGVSDNGVGLPAGLDWRQANSLGLRLVQMLSGQVGAEVKVNSGEGTGTRFEIVI